MVDDYMLDIVLHNIKKLIETLKHWNIFDKTKILIDTDNKLPDDITLRNVAILVTYVLKDDGKFYPQIFLEKALLIK